MVPVGVIQGDVTIHPRSPYPAQLGGTGISVFRGANLTINPNLGTPGQVSVTSDYRAGAPNTALYISRGAVSIVASPGGVRFSGNGESVHGLHMPATSTGASLLTGANVVFTTTGNAADGIRMDGASSTVELSNSVITVSGANSWGLHSWDRSNATLTGVSVNALGSGGGLQVYNNSAATLNGTSSVTTVVDGSIGALATAGGVLNTNTDASKPGVVSIETGGTDSPAVRIDTATGNLNRVLLSTVGDRGYGLQARGTSTVTGSSLDVSTKGVSAYGMWISGDTAATLNGGVIETRGTTAYGLFAGIGGATVNLSDYTITTSGSKAYGIYAWTGSNTNYAGGSISTSQAGTYGIYVDAGVVKLLRSAGGVGTAVTTVGADAHAVYTKDGGEFYATGATLHAQGAGSAGIVFDAPEILTPPPGAHNMALSGTSVTSDQSSALRIDGGIANVALTDATLTGATAVLHASSRSGSGGGQLDASVRVDASNTTLKGRILTDALSHTALNLTNGSHWLVSADSNLSNLSNANSLIEFPQTAALAANPTDASLYHSVRISGSYVGNGGTIALNSWLEGDGSPSDRLIIDSGTATGSTHLQVRNSGGAGALTGKTGILLVEAVSGGSTSANAFNLASPLRAGAYNYALFKGADDSSNPENWYLRSEFVPSPDPSDPVPVPVPPKPLPILGPELATYGVVHPSARQMGLAALGTFHERVDNALSAPKLAGEADSRRRSTWMRVFGQDTESHYQAYAAPRSDTKIIGTQAGLDLWRSGRTGEHRDIAGVSVSYTRGKADVSGLVTNAQATAYELVHTGQLKLNAYSVGGYWTHIGPNGGYVDGVLQATRYSGNARSNNTALSTRGHGWLASLEGGYPMALPWGHDFVLEPQAQVIWQRVSFNSAADDFGAVNLGSSSGLTARIGLRAQWTIHRDNGDVWQPYVQTNLWRDMDGESTVVYADRDRIPLSMQTTRLELAAGLTAKLSDAAHVYAQLGFQKGVHGGDQRRHVFQGTAGVRFNW